MLLPTPVRFVKLVLDGNRPSVACPYLIGANLTALRKEDGGVRLIAVGGTLRWLVAKVAGKAVMEDMASL